MACCGFIVMFLGIYVQKLYILSSSKKSLKIVSEFSFYVHISIWVKFHFLFSKLTFFAQFWTFVRVSLYSTYVWISFSVLFFADKGGVKFLQLCFLFLRPVRTTYGVWTLVFLVFTTDRFLSFFISSFTNWYSILPSSIVHKINFWTKNF